MPKQQPIQTKTAETANGANIAKSRKNYSMTPKSSYLLRVDGLQNAQGIKDRCMVSHKNYQWKKTFNR